MSIKCSKKFGICRFCGARVKRENMAAHERKIHPGLVSKGEEESSHEEREREMNDDEIRALCRKASKLLQSGLTTEAIIKKYSSERYDSTRVITVLGTI